MEPPIVARVRYLLVGSDEEIGCFSQLFRGNWPDDLALVASTSAGMVACERARMSYTTLDRYSPRAEIIALGWNNYPALSAFCERWDGIAQGIIPSLKARGIKPFRFGYYDLKILIDSVSTKLLMLKNFLRHAAGQEIFYLPEADDRIASAESLLPRREANMVSILLETILSGEARLSPLPGRRSAGRIRLRSLPRAWLLSTRAQLVTIRNAIRRLRSDRRKDPYSGYLCFNYGHDIQYVVPHLLRRHLRAISMPGPTKSVSRENVEECTYLWRRLSTDEDFRGFFSYGGASYFSLIKESLAGYVQTVLPRALANYDDLRARLSGLDIRFSLTSTINLGLVNRCRMLAAQASGAPLITYHEGAGYGSIITPIYDFTEVLDGDFMLCYGLGNSEYYRDLGTAKKPIVPVGSAHQEAVRRGLRNDPPPLRIRTAMYVGTAVDDNVMHCPNNGLVSTFYCSTQIKIFRLLASLPAETRVFAKPNSADVVSRRLLQLPDFKRIRLESRQFEKVMDGVDLFILDFPSTVLLSCIGTTAYVFVLAEEGVTGFTRKQKERLEKRAYLFDDFDSLAVAVQEIVTSTAGFSPRLDESYLLAYGLHQLDGHAAQRAADVLAGLAAVSA